MAKIEMDISEYEAMKETASLLKSSLEKERLLYEQIKTLTDEKTKAFEDAKMKVVKTTRAEVIEHLYVKIKHINTEAYIELCDLLHIDRSRSYITPDKFGGINNNRIIDILFDRVKIMSQPVSEITTHGLDDIKAELREELKVNMDSDINIKIQNAEKVLSKSHELIKQHEIITSENISILKKNKELITQVNILTNKVAELETSNDILNKIKDILKDGYGFWNKSKILDKLISLFP